MFSVIGNSQALDALADVMVRSDLATQDLIERIVKRFNSRLAADPVNQGESRGGNRRIALDAPCAITFFVEPEDQVVKVTHFWTY